MKWDELLCMPYFIGFSLTALNIYMMYMWR